MESRTIVATSNKNGWRRRRERGKLGLGCRSLNYAHSGLLLRLFALGDFWLSCFVLLYTRALTGIHQTRAAVKRRSSLWYTCYPPSRTHPPTHPFSQAGYHPCEWSLDYCVFMYSFGWSQSVYFSGECYVFSVFSGIFSNLLGYED